MNTSLVMTLLGPDRPGIVEKVSEAVAAHGGNWLEGRMARLSGQFAGILRIECPEREAEALIARLRALQGEDLQVQVISDPGAEAGERIELTIDVVGNDRPGIVRRIAGAVKAAGGNIEELSTRLESAPMAGHPMFHASGTVSLPAGADTAALVGAIEHLGDDLAVTCGTAS